MIAILGLILGVAVGIWLSPTLPPVLQPYLPINIVAAMDAVSYTHLTLPTSDLV